MIAEARQVEMMEGKLEFLLNKAAATNQAALQRVHNDTSNVRDYLVPLGQPNVGFDGFEASLELLLDSGRFTFNNHALSQMATKLGVPSGYIRTLVQSDWGRELTAEIFQKHTDEQCAGKTLLVRAIDGEVRGVLSDKYRRYDHQAVVNTFLSAVDSQGAVFYECVHSETRMFFKCVIPELHYIETEHNGVEVLAFGAMFKDSMFGASSQELSLFTLKPVCANGMVGESQMRSVHLGSKIHDEGVLSQETLRYYTEYAQGAIRDIMGSVLNREAIEQRKERIKALGADTIDIQKEVLELPQLGLTKEETDSVFQKLLNSNPDEGVVGAPTLLKLVNAVNSVGNDQGGERMIELQEVAGKIAGI